MVKYIGFDIDSKETVVCVVQKGERDEYTNVAVDLNNANRLLTEPLPTSVKTIRTLERLIRICYFIADRAKFVMYY